MLYPSIQFDYSVQIYNFDTFIIAASLDKQTNIMLLVKESEKVIQTARSGCTTTVEELAVILP